MNVLERFGLELMSTLAQTWDGLLMAIGDYNILFDTLDIAVIAGRPYHVDPEINHGIDQLIASFGLVIVSEDAVWQLAEEPKVHVLNQWTYHSRMYGAAKIRIRSMLAAVEEGRKLAEQQHSEQHAG